METYCWIDIFERNLVMTGVISCTKMHFESTWYLIEFVHIRDEFMKTVNAITLLSHDEKKHKWNLEKINLSR